MSKRNTVSLLTAIILILSLCVGCGVASIKDNGAAKPSLFSKAEDKQTMYARLSKSVVFINVYDDKDRIIATASGFIINDDKTLVTCDHVIEGAYYIEAVSEDGTSAICKEVIAHDADRDLAVLRCENSTNLTPLALGDSSTLVQGDSLFVIGSPLGLQNTISEGIVSALRADGDTDMVQITAPISSGSSGGAVFDGKGNVIGIVTGSFTKGQNLNLAIASNEITEMLSEDAGTAFLSDLYADYIAYGLSSMNLSGGGAVAENSKYVFFIEEETTLSVCKAARIKQFSKENGEYKSLDTGKNCASYLNIYRNKLYYVVCIDDRYYIYCCNVGDHFGEQNEMLLSFDENIQINRMLLAEDTIIIETRDMSIDVDVEIPDSLFNAFSIKLIDVTTLESIVDFYGFKSMRYVDNTLCMFSTTLFDRMIKCVDLKTAEISEYSVPVAAPSSYATDGALLCWPINYHDGHKSSIYKFDTANGAFQELFSDYCIEDVCACNDRTILVIEKDGNSYVTYIVRSGSKTLCDTQFSEDSFGTTYSLNYSEEISELGWKQNSILGLWRANGESYSLQS